jgi:nucleotide-binding universal stress UspA family protein
VAFDGSPGAWLALERAIEIARGQHAILDLVAVLELPRWSLSAGIGLGGGAPVNVEALRKEVELALERQLAAARDEVPATVSVRTRILAGRASKVLAALAGNGDYDLVVTGSRPVAPRWRRWLRRGVTQTLLTRTTVSVLAVREG